MFVRGAHAVALAEVFSPHVKLFMGLDSHHDVPKEISFEQAQETIQGALKNSVYVEVPEARLIAIVERLHDYHTAVGNIGEVTHELTEKITGERARFIRDTSARLLAVYLTEMPETPPSFTLIEKSIGWATMLANEIWGRLDKELGMGVEDDG